jgi:cytochrome P450
MADQDHLPYANALVKEIFRWNAVLPQGVAHVLDEDVAAFGYLLPKGSVLFAHAEAMQHDPRDYHDPYRLDPTRYLPELSGRPAERDSYSIGFGFGRRKCAGIRVADAGIFMACAMIGATLDITKLVVDGAVVEPVFEKGSGFISQPKPYRIAVKPRSTAALALLRGE